MSYIELRYTPLFADPSLISYWRFEGNSIDEKSLNSGSDTSISYGTGYGKVGQGAGLSQTSGSKITVASPSSGLDLPGDFTIITWVIPSSTQPDAYARVFDRGYGLMLVTDGGAQDDGWSFLTGQPAEQIGTAGTVDYDVLQMVTIRRVTNTYYLYKNKSLLDAQTYTSVNASGPFYFGSQSGTGRYINAGIDECAVFSRGLSITEIQNLYDGNYPRPKSQVKLQAVQRAGFY